MHTYCIGFVDGNEHNGRRFALAADISVRQGVAVQFIIDVEQMPLGSAHPTIQVKKLTKLRLRRSELKATTKRPQCI